MTYMEEAVDLSVLYVEDDELSRSGIFNALKRKVKNIHFAANGQEGLEVFKEHRPDVVITDIKMPLLNGLEMAKQILEMEPSVEIIVATAFEDAELFKRAIDLDVDKYLTKPLDVTQILMHLKRIEMQKRLEREFEVYSRALNEVASIFWFDLELECLKVNPRAIASGGEHGVENEKLKEMARLALEKGGSHQEGNKIFSVAFNVAKEPKGFCLCVMESME
ncbi:response regulator transcription factor [Wolinella succinogenes]|uniref:response regulator transcription factor n=1 Tax=Wolinella succinogenes TaxID=844 RepID=UPI00168F7EE9|nr:response regulator [Wolinella succinogenes]NLU33631.1 response regulator [Wolinella succinogenes]